MRGQTRSRRRSPRSPLGEELRATRRRLGPPRRNKRRRRAPLLLWLLAILTIEIVAVGLKDPRFNLKRIEVRGGETLAEEQVVRRCGLRPGINLFRLHLEDARQRLLSVPAVADATLHRRLPDRVVIRVRERQPMACVAAKNSRFTIDAEGVAFRKDAKPPRGLPLVAGLEAEPLRLGARVDLEKTRALRAFVEAAAAHPRRGVPRVSIDQNANLCFNSAELGYQVRLGPAVQLKEKLALLAALERSLPDIRERCEYIDLSCPEAPAWKPRKVALAASGHAGASRPVALPGDTLHGRGGFAQD